MPIGSDITRPPSPPPSGWLGRLRTIHGLATDLVGFVGRRFETLGDIYYVPNADGGLYVIRHPDHIREVLVTHADCYAKTHSAFTRLSRVLGQGLLNTDGDVWRRQRRMIQPAFHKARLVDYSHMMVEETTKMIDRWRNGSAIDLNDELTEVTLRIVSRALFSHDVGNDVAAITAGRHHLAGFHFSTIDVTPAWFPNRKRQKTRDALRSLDALMYALIAERRAATQANAGAGPPDLLQRLLDARDEEGDGAGLSDKEIRDQLVTFLRGRPRDDLPRADLDVLSTVATSACRRENA